MHMSQAARLFHICRRLADGRTVTAQTLQDELEVARATVYRDIAVLKDQLNAPIEWDAMAESYRLATHGNLGDPFVVPGLWMTAQQLYGMLTVLNIASALDPGVAARFSSEYRGLLKRMMSEQRISGFGIDRKIAVELPLPGKAAQEAMQVIGPALMLDAPVRLFAQGLGEHDGMLVVPLRLVLRHEGWWLDYRPLKDEVQSSIALASVVGAQEVRE